LYFPLVFLSFPVVPLSFPKIKGDNRKRQ
jgi:hypothetical protein